MVFLQTVAFNLIFILECIKCIIIIIITFMTILFINNDYAHGWYVY